MNQRSQGSFGSRSFTLPAAFLLVGAVVATVALLSPRPTRAGITACDCQSCHGDHHGGNWSGCQACHQSPPQTGSHLIHVDNADTNSGIGYGDVGVHSTAEAYKFGCGNCHPLDSTKHMNGNVDVELYNASSPAGSLKAKNPATASWSSGAKTCTNVYCHSGKVVTASGPTGEPLKNPPNPVPPGYSTNSGWIMDATCSNFLYASYPVAQGRGYATTPAWGTSGTFSTCAECHQFPLTTSHPSVDGGAGDTHQWVDSYGYGNLHAYNMGYDPLPCRTCHYSTVTQAGTWSRDAMDVTTYGPVPVASHVTHVNGAPDVAFDGVDGVTYRNTYMLTSSTWDPATKTCAAVPCHASPPVGRVGARWQTQPKWGQPYRWGSSPECDLCHRYSLSSTCTPAP